MNVVLLFAGLAVVLFVSAFITRRRFGLLGLALAAGSVLSGIWSVDAGLVVGTIGVIPPGPLTTSLTLAAVVLLPSIVLLFHGHTYKSLIGRVVGALLFTVLALAFLVTPLGFSLPLNGIGGNVYAQLVKYKEVIISIGLVIAVVDLFFTKPAAPLLERKSKR